MTDIIVSLVYPTVAVVVAIIWEIFRDRHSNGSYPPEEEVVFNAMLVGALWPFELIGIPLVIAVLIWNRARFSTPLTQGDKP